LRTTIGLRARFAPQALTGLLVAWIFPPSPVLAQAESCSAVTTASLNVAATVITGSKLDGAEKDLPRHCILTGKCAAP
jgi:hypothetical protein